MTKDCLFCKIISGEIKADIIYQNDDVVVFRDINPKAPVHVLVIPTRHIERLTDKEATDGKMLEKIFLAVQKVASDLGLEEGFRVVSNCGHNGGQTVYHIHFHVLGQRQLDWPPG